MHTLFKSRDYVTFLTRTSSIVVNWWAMKTVVVEQTPSESKLACQCWI